MMNIDTPESLTIPTDALQQLQAHQPEEPVIRIEATGEIFWQGRKIETDDEFKSVIVEILKLTRPQIPLASLRAMMRDATAQVKDGKVPMHVAEVAFWLAGQP